ncbi:MAG: PQQ-binding-like beta-propeller repeat protein [Gemmataceae bacterium]
MKQWFVWSLIGIVVVSCGGASAQEKTAGKFDWPQWRGPNRDGISAETGLLKRWPVDGLELVWKTRGIGRGFSSVVVSKGKLYTMGDRDGNSDMICLDEKTGKELWATRIRSAHGNGPRSTPTVDGDKVYGVGREGILGCVDAANGKLHWTVDFRGKRFKGYSMSGWDYSESVLIDGDKLICTPGADKAAVAALDKKTGKTIWQTQVPNCRGAGYASLVVSEGGGVRQYITLLGNGAVGVRAKDGKLLWRYNKVTNGTANIPTPIVYKDYVLLSTAYQTGTALLKLTPDGKGGIDAMEQYFLKGKTELQNHHGGLIRIGEYVYGGHGHNEGFPFCLHWKTGKFMWGPRPGPGRGSAAVLYADGHFYFQYESGHMALIEANPKKRVVKSVFLLPKEFSRPRRPHPTIANGRLYVRSPNGWLLCYNVKAKS